MFARQPIGALTGFAIGVLLTLLVFSVAFGLGHLSSESPAPKPLSPNPYPTLTLEPTGSPTGSPSAAAGIGSRASPGLPTEAPPSTPRVATPTAPPPTPSVTTPTEAPVTISPAIPTPSATPTAMATPVPSPVSLATTTPADPLLTSEIVLVTQKGYDVVDASHARSGGPLGVLIGKALVRGEPAEYAFFFVNGSYIGTDLPESSASISVAAQTGDTATIRYALYRVADPECCPSGGYQDVPYYWDGTRLTPQTRYPTYVATAPLSRR